MTFAQPIAEQIWDMKYRLKEADGTVIDETVEDTWKRIANALAAPEAEQVREGYAKEFYDVLSGFKFLPGGRIIAGSGTGRSVTLMNCYVLGTIPDSMSGIFDMLKEAALTMQQGGGIGYDFSTIRPKGSLVVGVAADASGPLTFMDCWDAMCKTVMSAGSRRGAMMATMRCDHPDIEAFIEAKSDPLRLRMFNVSVMATTKFMEAVKNDTDFDLVFGGKVYKTVRATELWDKIMRSTYDYAEPGVIFIDRINDSNNLWAIETIAATNPCGEIPLPPYGACLLGSLNLAKFVTDPFDLRNARFDFGAIAMTVNTAVRMMDNVVDVTKYPLPAQEVEAKQKRRIGLGVTALADALTMLGIRYGSDEAVEVTETVMKFIADSAYKSSIGVAREKEAYPLFSADVVEPGSFAAGRNDGIRQAIVEHGMRNSHLLAIAPTGTISLYAGNVSSGIEPIFAFDYTRKVLQKDGTRTEERVSDYAVHLYREMHGADAELPDYFVTAQTLSPLDHVKMQAAVQKHIDQSISKTVNCPEDISFEDFKEVYQAAYDSGCKGCTTYRPNAVTGSVLSVDAPKKEEPVEEATYETANDDILAAATAEPITERPDALHGTTYKLKWPGNEHAIYISINDVIENGARRPFEVFINSKNMEHFAWTVALTRMISAVFRRPHDSRFVVEELKAVFDPKGGAWMSGGYVPSLLAAIGGVIERHMVSIGYMGREVAPGIRVSADQDLRDVVARNPEDFAEPYPSKPTGPQCSACGSFNMKKENGCSACLDCGHSSCG